MSALLKVKLTSGEWVIGEAVETLQGDSENFVRLKNALTIHIVQRGPQEYGVAMMPFDPTGPDGIVELYRSAIVARPTVISKELSDAYLRQTTGIEIATSLESVK